MTYGKLSNRECNMSRTDLVSLKEREIRKRNLQHVPSLILYHQQRIDEIIEILNKREYEATSKIFDKLLTFKDVKLIDKTYTAEDELTITLQVMVEV